MDIIAQISLSGRVEYVIHDSPRSGESDDTVAIHFTLSGVFPPSRVHEALAEKLNGAAISWITARRHYCEVDLDAARVDLPDTFRADWLRGRVKVEPEIIAKPREGAIGLHPETEIILCLNREDVVLSQQSRIFLSHKSANKPMVRRFYDVLEELGFAPWLDEEDMLAGENVHRGLQAGMRSSCGAVFFITPEFRDERYLKTEIEWALHEETERGARFRIITLAMLNDKGERGTVPDILRRFIFKEPHTELEALEDILRALPVRIGPVEWRAR